MKLKIIALLCLLITSAGLLHAQEVIKIGIIGLDTSHAPAFIKLLNSNDPLPEHKGIVLPLFRPLDQPFTYMKAF